MLLPNCHRHRHRHRRPRPQRFECPSRSCGDDPRTTNCCRGTNLGRARSGAAAKHCFHKQQQQRKFLQDYCIFTTALLTGFMAGSPVQRLCHKIRNGIFHLGNSLSQIPSPAPKGIRRSPGQPNQCRLVFLGRVPNTFIDWDGHLHFPGV